MVKFTPEELRRIRDMQLNNRNMSVIAHVDNVSIQHTEMNAAKDIISTLPQNIIETILCHLHIRDAVRTSVLSRNWRYSWTRIPNLVFVEDTFEKLTGSDQLCAMARQIKMQGLSNRMLQRCKFLYAIYQVLLMHQGPIFQLTLDMEAGRSCLEIDQIILLFSRSNTVTELKLRLLNESDDLYELPLSIYSLHHLTDLHLRDCRIYHQPTFSGFGSLTTLYLEGVRIYTKTLLHLLSKSPLLKRVTLLEVYDIDDDGYFPFIELFECLPLIEHLTTCGLINKDLIKDAVPQKLPTSLVHLKYVSLQDVCYIDNREILFLAILIKSSPNLENINLQFYRWIFRPEQYIETNPVTLDDHYSNIWLEHLYELEIIDFTNLKHSMEFVKLILTKSPVLKKARIVLNDKVTKDQEMRILRILLRCPSVSPIVEIIVDRPSSVEN